MIDQSGNLVRIDVDLSHLILNFGRYKSEL